MLIMAIGAQNAFCCQGLRREHVLPVVALCALSDAVLLGGGVGHGRCVAGARPSGEQWMRWAGAAFLLAYAFAGRGAGTAAGPAAGDGEAGRGQQPAQHGAHAAGLTWLNPMCTWTPWCCWAPWQTLPHGAGGLCHWRGLGQRAVVPAIGFGAHAGWRHCSCPRRGGCWMGTAVCAMMAMAFCDGSKLER